MQIRCETARHHWLEAGPKVDGQMAFIDRGLITELVAKAPSEFELALRNKKRGAPIGGRNTVFSTMPGPPDTRNRDGVRRESALNGIHDFNKPIQISPRDHVAPSLAVEATDMPDSYRHLEWGQSSLVHTHMPFLGALTELQRARDTIELRASRMAARSRNRMGLRSA